jgi:hypothetical protein
MLGLMRASVRGPAAKEEARPSRAAAAIEPAVTYFSERDARRPKGIDRKEALGRLIERAAAHQFAAVWARPGARVSLTELLAEAIESAPEEKADAATAARVIRFAAVGGSAYT